MTLPTPKRLAREYERGASFRALAAKYGCTERTVRRHVAGLVDPRSTGPRRLKVSDEEIIRLRSQGIAWRTIAQQLGMSEAGLRKRHRIATEGVRPWV